MSRKIACVEAVTKKRYRHLLNVKTFYLFPEGNVHVVSDRVLPSQQDGVRSYRLLCPCFTPSVVVQGRDTKYTRRLLRISVDLFDQARLSARGDVVPELAEL